MSKVSTIGFMSLLAAAGNVAWAQPPQEMTGGGGRGGPGGGRRGPNFPQQTRQLASPE
jgi:hypothetical protein